MSTVEAPPPAQGWSPPRFTPADYEARIARVREACAERGLAGVLLYDQASLYYLFGYDQLGYWVYQTVFLPADGGEPVAICRAPDELLMRESPWLQDVRVWLDETGTTPGELTAEILAARGVGAGARIGAELRSHALLACYAEDVRRTLPSTVELVDASDLVADLRVVKSAAEVEHFRTAAGYLEAAYAAARDALVPGTRECDLHAAVTAAMYGLGADPPAIPTPIASGPRTLAQTHVPATQRAIEPGEPVVIEVGAAAARYHAVGARCLALGDPDPEAVRLYADVGAALDTGFARIGPGEPIAGAAQAVQAELRRRGHSRAGRHVGYGTGIGYPPTWLESLRIKTTAPGPFVPGMTLFYFAGVVAPSGRFCLYVGEPVLITEQGYERVAPAAATWE